MFLPIVIYIFIDQIIKSIYNELLFTEESATCMRYPPNIRMKNSNSLVIYTVRNCTDYENTDMINFFTCIRK